MQKLLHSHADYIISSCLRAVSPERKVRETLLNENISGRVILVAVGKAAWRMAKEAYSLLSKTAQISGGIITKYGHSEGEIGNLEIFEAGHPVPDENSFKATAAILDMVKDLKEDDTVLFLLSGGGSALFEKPLVPPAVLSDITDQLLSCGADITEINTIRKRLSAVKGGRFAQICAPARVLSVILSDVLGDRPDMIASGPSAPDLSRAGDALRVAEKYSLRIPAEVEALLKIETPKKLDNVKNLVVGSVRELCRAAKAAAEELGYETLVLTDMLSCEAKEAGSFLSSILITHSGGQKPLAFIAGGETVVHVLGDGLGGRNEELALSAAKGISGLPACVFSLGSDGTDGPTDAAGGYADGDTLAELGKFGIDPDDVLRDNDSYRALKKVGGLIVTGPTGTNVNDVSVGLLNPKAV